MENSAPAESNEPAPTISETRVRSKRLILLLDGTWNDAAFGSTDTNIVRLSNLIARTLHIAGQNDGTREPKVTSYAYGDKDTYVMYERGVGTSAFLDHWVGGTFGEGITNNIRRAYKFLSFHYELGDQIFIFGFSRGAYTARSLVGMLNAPGLLKRDCCTEALEQDVWDYYRSAPNDRLPGAWSALSPHINQRDKLRVACLGVFDTVGALGIPLAPLRRANRDKYEFHDVELSSIVDVNLHSLALDEHREPFEAALWRRSKFKQFKTTTEQVWFPGAHADVGGGYFAENEHDQDGELVPRLDDITLSWMIKRIKSHYRDFPVNEALLPAITDSGPSPPADKPKRWALAHQHNPRKGIYRLMPTAFRSVANVAVQCKPFPILPGFGETNVSHDRHADVENEMVHICVLERLGESVRMDRKTRRYWPKNLNTVLPAIKAGLTRDTDAGAIFVVGWNGEVIAPQSPAATSLLERLNRLERVPMKSNHLSAVMPALVAGIKSFLRRLSKARRGWPGQVRP